MGRALFCIYVLDKSSALLYNNSALYNNMLFFLDAEKALIFI